jgi:flap endonuclease-1
MGIKDLNKFIKDQQIDCFFNIPLTNFSNYRVAIDGLNWLFKYLNMVYKNLLEKREDILVDITQEELFDALLLEWIRFNNKFMNHKITPVWIWDGISKDNKTVTKIERKKSRNEYINRRNKLKEQLLNMHILDRDESLLKEYKKLVIITPYFSPDNINKLKEFSKKVGIPTIFAKDEAENLASSLAVERKIAAVWSQDTDTYPLGAPIVLLGFERVKDDIYIKGVFTPNILKKLELNHQEFRDFCIMLGTDFNDRIEKIGPANAYKLIKKYRNLETIGLKTKHDIYCLKKDEVRPQLTPYDTNIEEDILNVKYEMQDIKFNNHYMQNNFVNFMNNIRDLGNAKNLPKTSKPKEN